MSQENVASLRQALDAFNRRDRAAWLALCDPEMENVPPRDWPESDTVRGSEAVWDFFVQALDTWEAGPFQHFEAIDAGNDKVAMNIRREVRGKASGVSLTWSYWQLVAFHNGKIVRSEWFASRGEALEAVGLTE